jgi:DNA primase
MATPVEQIKARLSIGDVVSEYVKLERAGGNFRARCPFHQEKTPSFYVSPSRGTYHCFGCARGGDIFSFVEEIEGLTFPEALRRLAERAGVTLSFERKEEVAERVLLQEVLLATRDYYKKALGGNASALEYLKKRGLTPETIESFNIGYAPLGWEHLTLHLLKEGYTPSVMVKAGLVLPSEKTPGRFYDRFRNRVMFPLEDASGHTIAFSGRTLSSDPKEAKYINSPETVLFKKGEVLYGYNRAKETIRKKNQAVLVEGQMDLVLSHQAGITETVATSGTAFSAVHAGLLGRLAETVIIAFDADTAGETAGRKATALLTSAGIFAKAVVLPEGEDPADVVRKDPTNWEEKIAQAPEAVLYFIQSVERREQNQRVRQETLLRDVLPLIASMPSAVLQSHAVDAFARAAAVSPELVWADLRRLVLQPTGTVRAGGVLPVPLGEKKVRRARVLGRELAGLATWLAEKKIEHENFLGERYTVLRDTHPELFLLSEEEKSIFSFKADVLYSEPEKLLPHLPGMIKELALELLREELRESEKALREAEDRGDQDAVDRNTKKCQDIAKEITHLALHP